MISRDLPVTKFIDGIVNGLISCDESDCIRHESIYEDAFRLGYENKGNESFIATLLDFWLDYVKFMQETKVVVTECDVESCEICSTENVEGCDCHSDDDPERDDDGIDE